MEKFNSNPPSNQYGTTSKKTIYYDNLLTKIKKTRYIPLLIGLCSAIYLYITIFYAPSRTEYEYIRLGFTWLLTMILLVKIRIAAHTIIYKLFIQSIEKSEEIDLSNLSKTRAKLKTALNFYKQLQKPESSLVLGGVLYTISTIIVVLSAHDVVVLVLLFGFLFIWTPMHILFTAIIQILLRWRIISLEKKILKYLRTQQALSLEQNAQEIAKLEKSFETSRNVIFTYIGILIQIAAIFINFGLDYEDPVYKKTSYMMMVVALLFVAWGVRKDIKNKADKNNTTNYAIVAIYGILLIGTILVMSMQHYT